MWKKIYRFLWIMLFLFLTGCKNPIIHSPVESSSTQTIVFSTSTPIIQPTTALPDTPTASQSPIATRPVSPTSTATSIVASTKTLTVTPTPFYEVLRGEVNVEHVMCFYGPSKAYLYKYGLLGGNNLDILGILPDTGYIQVQAIGGDNPCWMNLEWMDVKGDIFSLIPVDPSTIELPRSPYYGPLTSITASRQGNMVTISWNPLVLRAGDDSEQEPYLVETWVCQSNMLRFIPFGLYETTLTVEDQHGCNESSHGRVYGVEKHGYTLPIEIPWP